MLIFMSTSREDNKKYVNCRVQEESNCSKKKKNTTTHLQLKTGKPEGCWKNIFLTDKTKIELFALLKEC